MTSINDLKIKIISFISNVEDFSILKSFDSRIKLLEQPSRNNSLSFENGIVEIRKNISKDVIFSEQGNKHLSFLEIKNLTQNLEWECSLQEMLNELS